MNDLNPPPMSHSHLPPPETRRHSGVKPLGSYLMTTEEENSEIDGENVNVHLETKRDIINSLPDDIVLDILIRFPAQDIYSITRLVCRNWYKMIRTNKFVYAHLQRSDAHGILIQSRVGMKFQLSFMSVQQQGQIEITRVNYEPISEIWCSCNGLILESECRNHYALRVTNPATMQHFNLPRFSGISIPCTTAIAYAAATMEYKVIRRYPSTYEGGSGTPYAAAILTVGVDSSWRLLRTQHLSPEANNRFVLDPLITEGFVHWPKKDTYVLSLNVETEVIAQYRVPLCLREGLNYLYFPAVRNLALLVKRGRFSWDLWEMKPESGEWTKVTSIDLEAKKWRTIKHLICERDTSFKLVECVRCVLRPVGWLKYRQVLVFHVCKVFINQESNPRREGLGRPRLCIAYNVHSMDIELIELDSIPRVFLNHTNGLVWLGGC